MRTEALADPWTRAAQAGALITAGLAALAGAGSDAPGGPAGWRRGARPAHGR